MPGTDGFQLCDKLRQVGPNKSTPVIFVTATADFQVRAQSTLRGASDLIAKPFMFLELTVKALTFALRHRIDARRQGRATGPGQPSPAAAETADLII
jgi:CheY-like chemotaxis protein